MWTKRVLFLAWLMGALFILSLGGRVDSPSQAGPAPRAEANAETRSPTSVDPLPNGVEPDDHQASLEIEAIPDDSVPRLAGSSER